MTGIYKIQSIIKPERFYVGSAIDIYYRWRKHKEMLRRNKHHSIKLQRHFNKYDESDLKFSILITCDKDDLENHEQFFIDSLNPWFNISKVVGTVTGLRWKLSPETIAKHKLYKPSVEANKKNSIAHLGDKNVSKRPEVRLKISEKNRGKKLAEEHKQKLRKASLKVGCKPPLWPIGKRHTEETKHKISEAKKKYWKLRKVA